MTFESTVVVTPLDQAELDADMTRKNFRWFWQERLVTLTRQIWFGHTTDKSKVNNSVLQYSDLGAWSLLLSKPWMAECVVG